MSIMRMKKNMARYTRWAMYFFVAVFIFGSLFFFGSTPFGERRAVGAMAPSPVASVNGTPISREEFNAHLRAEWEQARMFGGAGPTQVPFLKQQVLRNLEERTLQLQAADREGVRVTNKEITEQIQQQVSQQVMMVKFRTGEKAFRREIKEKYGTEQDYINYLVDSVSSEEREATEEQLKLQKLQELIKERVKATEAEYRASQRKAKARLIFVRTQTPAAQPGKPQPDARAAEAAAKAKAEAILKEIKAGADFAEVAKAKSDDAATKAKGGLIEGWLPAKPTPEQTEQAQWFKRGDKKYQYGDEFDAVVFSKLKPGEVSDVFKGSSGYYIVKLEDLKEDLPQDYNDVDYQCEEKKHDYTWTQSYGEAKTCPMCNAKDIQLVKTTPPPPPAPGTPPDAPKPQPTREYLCPKKTHTYNWTEKGREAKACPKCGAKTIKLVARRKDNYLRTFEDSKKNEAWSKYLQDLKKNAKTDIYDPELKAYKIQNDFSVTNPAERKKQLKEAVKLYRQALTYNDPFISPAAIYLQMAQAYNQLGDKKGQLNALLEASKREESLDVRLELGRFYKEQKKTAKAIEEFKKASALVTPQQYYIHTQLAEEFKQLKRNDLAEKERKLAVPPKPSSGGAGSLPFNLQ
ncbi:MAG: peptidylprolyl isomerase [Abditibacteriales bacterium]|nr:peptidylprolyl isomerase [Abditibacteriales bacterium]MDW8366999.1 peptidylprolyl isomerase [Abditibacteriales bacterium]